MGKAVLNFLKTFVIFGSICISSTSAAPQPDGFFVDYPLKNSLFAGIYGDLHRVKVKEYDEKSALEFGGMFKLTMPAKAKRIFIRPGIGLGGAMLQSIGNAGVTYYLTYRAALELHCTILDGIWGSSANWHFLARRWGAEILSL